MPYAGSMSLTHTEMVSALHKTPARPLPSVYAASFILAMVMITAGGLVAPGVRKGTGAHTESLISTSSAASDPVSHTVLPLRGV